MSQVTGNSGDGLCLGASSSCTGSNDTSISTNICSIGRDPLCLTQNIPSSSYSKRDIR